MHTIVPDAPSATREPVARGRLISGIGSVGGDSDGRSRLLRPHRLLDAMLAALGKKNDAALARTLNISPTSLSRIRNGYRDVNADLVLRLHEHAQIPIAELKQLLDPGVRLR
jgi:hypothetical protein